MREEEGRNVLMSSSTAAKGALLISVCLSSLSSSPAREGKGGMGRVR